MSDGMGDKIDKIYERLTGTTGVPAAAGLFYKIPNSGKLSDLAIAVGKDLTKLTANNFFVRVLSISTSGYAGAACPSNSFNNSANISVSYNASTTAYSVNGTSVRAPGNDAHADGSIGYELYVKF